MKFELIGAKNTPTFVMKCQRAIFDRSVKAMYMRFDVSIARVYKNMFPHGYRKRAF